MRLCLSYSTVYVFLALTFVFSTCTVEGEEVGSIQSNLLCRSILDLYIGDDPFDKNAKDNVQENIASILKS